MKKTTAEAYLERPYRRVLIPDRETGTYTAEIAEFPGCVAEGKTPAEALRRLEAAAESWIDAVLDARQAVPEPMEEQQYSGKLVLRLSRSLHRQAAERAQAEGISLNQFIATTLAEHIVPILSLGIMKVDKVNNLTVDASVVNPARAPQRTTKRKGIVR